MLPLPTHSKLGLKEWAVACKALEQGAMVTLIRKGGIREPGKAFQVRERQFMLYPSYEHQKPELVKPAWHGALAQTLQGVKLPQQDITFSLFADTTDVVEVLEQERLELISPHHLWTLDYAQKRLHWKPRQALAVMLVRIYQMDPATLPILKEYNGCTSWVPLVQDVPLKNLTPVLSDLDYKSQVNQVLNALGVVAGAR
ncbi:MAG: DUF1802 family protein [Dehalococcoidia bacterium]|nr:DUF1802 family protein [Dehalococcoidia bacterium]